MSDAEIRAALEQVYAEARHDLSEACQLISDLDRDLSIAVDYPEAERFIAMHRESWVAADPKETQ